jgi:hypothetical protein
LVAGRGTSTDAQNTTNAAPTIRSALPGLGPAGGHLKRDRHHREGDDLGHAVEERDAHGNGQREQQDPERAFAERLGEASERQPVGGRLGGDRLQRADQPAGRFATGGDVFRTGFSCAHQRCLSREMTRCERRRRRGD